MRARPGYGCLAPLLLVVGCGVDLGPRLAAAELSFGEIVYREACQRVTYSAELDSGAAIDASGVRYRAFCLGLGEPPQGSPPIALALRSERKAIVDATNALVPPALLTPLDGYLRGLKPLEDEGTLGEVISSGGRLLDGLAGDEAAMAALSRLDARQGLRPPQLAGGIAASLVRSDALDGRLGALLPALSPSAPGSGDAPAEAAMGSLMAGLHGQLGDLSPLPKPGDSERTLAVALRLLLRGDPTLRTLPVGQEYPALLRDHRGLPQVAFADGKVTAPYVDRDADNLPDVNAQGNFVGVDGQPLPWIAPFPAPGTPDRAVARDEKGRALRQAGGAPLYRYADLDQTVLAALLREGQGLLDPKGDVPLGMLSGIAHLLGPRMPASRDLTSGALRYEGFDTSKGALIDLLHAAVQIVGYGAPGEAAPGSEMRRLLDVMRALLQNEREVSRSMAAIARALDEGYRDAYKTADLPDDATLWDDVAPLLVRLLRVDGLAEDLLSAVSGNEVAQLGPLLGKLANESGYYYMNQDQRDYRKDNAVTGTSRAVRRDLPDSDTDKSASAQNNRSVLQRVLHLVHDANGLTFCSKRDAKVRILFFDINYPDPCSVFKIDDLAMFYVLSVIGRDVERSPNAFPASATQGADFVNSLGLSLVKDLLRLLGIFNLDDGVIESQVGIPGFGRFPTPQAAARLLFQDPGKQSDLLKGAIDNGACTPRRPGTLCCNQDHGWTAEHDGVLFSLERIQVSGVNFFQAFSPIVRAFARHDECFTKNGQRVCRNAAKIIADFLAVLHRHYPTAESRFFGKRYEPQNRRAALSRYEPLLSGLLSRPDIDLWASTVALAPVLTGLRLQDGSPALPVLVRFLRWFLDPGAQRAVAPRYRDGRPYALRGDGERAFRSSGDAIITDVLDGQLAGKVTPYYLLADALRSKRARMAADPALLARWRAAMGRVGDQLLLSKPGPGYGFLSPRMVPLLQALVEFLRERTQAHGQAGDLASWVDRGLVDNLADSLTGPTFAASADLAARLSEVPGARIALQQIFASLTEPESFQAALTETADLLQILLNDGDTVPLLRALSAGLAKDGFALPSLDLLRRGREHDPDRVLLAIAKNAFQRDASHDYPLRQLISAVLELNRKAAGHDGVHGSGLDLLDYRSVLGSCGKFFGDHSRGLSRFIDIVAARD